MKPDATLTADCQPEPVIASSGTVTVEAVIEELESTRSALALCRERLSKLR